MKTYFDRLSDLGVRISREQTIDWISCSLPALFVVSLMDIVDDPNMTLMELHYLLIVAKASIQETAHLVDPILVIDCGSAKRKRVSHHKGKGKGKVVRSKSIPIKKVDSDIAPTSNPNEAISFYFQHKGHWKCSCRKSMEDVNKNKSNKFGTLSNFMIKFHST